VVTPRFGTIVRHLTDDPGVAPALVARLDDGVLAHVGAVVNDEIRRRALEAGDRDAVIADGFESGFGRDGLAVPPWVSGPFVVCPGGLVGKGRASHRCRFVSVDDTWIWESSELIEEQKRAAPGTDEGFRAVALLPVIDGMALDLVSGRLRSGRHSVDRVVSLEVRRGQLTEVSQRNVDHSRPPGY
jgi:hypothetical protein